MHAFKGNYIVIRFTVLGLYLYCLKIVQFFSATSVENVFSSEKIFSGFRLEMGLKRMQIFM